MSPKQTKKSEDTMQNTDLIECLSPFDKCACEVHQRPFDEAEKKITKLLHQREQEVLNMVDKIVDKVNEVNESNGRYNACIEIKQELSTLNLNGDKMSKNINNETDNVTSNVNRCTNCGNNVGKFGVAMPTLDKKKRYLCITCARDKVLGEISLCKSCNCMTKNVVAGGDPRDSVDGQTHYYICGKCGEVK